MVSQMTGDVLSMLDSENDGVRTHAIKFTESLIVTLSPRTPESDVPKRQEGDISLDKVPRDHPYIRYGTARGQKSGRRGGGGGANRVSGLQTLCVTRGRRRWTSC